VSPSKAELAAAHGATVPDVLAPGLDVVFVGINPGLWSGAVGHHFARPGNRFWRTLHGAGFTDRVLEPHEERELLEVGVGITNLVNRATATAVEVSDDELRRGAAALPRRLARYRPRAVAILGLGAYRTGFGRKVDAPGPRDETLGAARLWVLPNPSGLNAHYQLDALVEAFAQLRTSLGR
jgi:TDG/mug DNA glycosylase family protein